jgi:hypothetical protein
VTRFAERRRVQLPAAVVAATVHDWSQDVRWRRAVVEVDVVPARPGQQVREHLRFAGLLFVTPTTITAADETSVAFAGGSRSVAVSGRRTVVPDGVDACTVQLEVDVRLLGAGAPLTTALAPSYRRLHARDADELVRLLAGAHAGR